ncbi:hypothetical protein OG206_06695 [Streptomyces sp. NBC_01341]|uniref:hypothetical protein n=1 Tax=Streptomyces sp. NBC_01341 TaxID=2903831 RepID=UPI002E13500E|nr:hypothetical protein OG206_06695 [Streptomyces sp. NBC_01341]
MTLATVSLLLGLAGCSTDEKTKSVPELPKRVCWGAFAGADVAPLLPTGDAVTQRAEPFHYSEHVRSLSCLVYIDGNYGFRAVATRRDSESQIDWSSWDQARPKAVDAGKKGISWSDGAASYIPCEPTNSSPSFGKYVELDVTADHAPDEKQARRILPALLKQFTAFAEKELKCR